MLHLEFIELIAGRAQEGRRQLSMLARSLIYERDVDLLRRLDFSDDHAFLEPTLFSFFRSEDSSASLPQLLLGYMEAEMRPEQIPVVSDDRGTVHLPNLGYLFTAEPRRRMLLSWRGGAGDSALEAGGRAIDFTFRERDLVPGTEIEIYRACPPLFRPFFRDPQGRPVEAEVDGVAAQKAGLVKEACAIIEEVYGQYFALVRDNIRGFLLYDASDPYSFANLGAQGVAFLNTKPDSSPVFFVEDILHQCGHVIFTAATLNRGDVLAVDPLTPLSAVSELDDYPGGVYEAFHGLFTQININHCLRACRERRIFSGRHAHELSGRISDDMLRFGTAIHALGRRELYTDLGWELFCHFRDAFVSLYEGQRPLIERYDTSNQPYIFDFGRFLELNPLPEGP